jgi:small subunit ribosomal protein S4
MGALPRRGLPAWLDLDTSKYEGAFKAFPTREEMNLPVQEQLVVEFYSK